MTDKSIVETMKESRKMFEEAYGPTLTDKEAIELTSQIKRRIHSDSEQDESIDLKKIMDAN